MNKVILCIVCLLGSANASACNIIEYQLVKAVLNPTKVMLDLTKSYEGETLAKEVAEYNRRAAQLAGSVKSIYPSCFAMYLNDNI